MNKDNIQKLWVIKFCLKVIYPNFNSTCFLVFLAIKYRRWYHKRLIHGCDMESYAVKPLSLHVQRILTKDYLTHLMPVHLHKCFVISRDQFIQLAAENLFYIDNGILWVTVKLNPLEVKRIKQEKSKDKSIKYNLKFLQSDVQRKLLQHSSSSFENHRIVPIIGSKYVEDGVALTTENELYNLIGSFGLDTSHNLEICFHPLLSCEYAPKIAGLAEASLVLNDYDISNDFVKEILSNYFETPKLVHQNDMFSIELTPEITSKYSYKYNDLVESVGKLYFKCTKLGTDPPNSLVSNNVFMPYFIVKGVTQLTLGDGIHEIKPKDEYFPLQDTNSFQTQLIQLCPTGLKEKFNQIQETIAPFLTGDLNIISSSLSSPLIPMLLLTGGLGSGRHLLVKALAKFNGLNCLQIDCNALQSSTAKQTEAKISATIQKAKTASPTIVLLDNFEVFAVDAENNEDCRVTEYFSNSLTDLYENYTKHTIIFIAITEVTDLKPNIQRMFLEKFHIQKLNVDQRYEMLKWFITVMNINIGNHENNDDTTEKIELNFENNNIKLPKLTEEALQRVAAKTETFLYGDLDTLVHFVLRESYLEQLNKSSVTSPDPQMNLIQEEHFNCAIESMRRLQSHQLDAPKIPKVYWEDIGGLDKLKKELLKTIEFPIKYPHLFKNSSLKRSGILLYGPPGCGKTLVAKAVSTELNVSFLSVKGPELLNMYIGQSEENVRRVFRSARASSPCVVFLDELDALAARRGAAGDSGGAADRLVSQLLAELDGVHAHDESDTSSFVFVMGATNRPDLIEQSLLRPGRLDKLIYVGPYCGEREKTSVMTALCRSVTLRPSVSLPGVVSALPPRVTGADLLRVLSTARGHALRALVKDVQDGKVKESELSPSSVVIGVSEMWKGVENFRPSVSDEELAYYESLKSQM